MWIRASLQRVLSIHATCERVSHVGKRGSDPEPEKTCSFHEMLNFLCGPWSLSGGGQGTMLMLPPAKVK